MMPFYMFCKIEGHRRIVNINPWYAERRVQCMVRRPGEDCREQGGSEHSIVTHSNCGEHTVHELLVEYQ